MRIDFLSTWSMTDGLHDIQDVLNSHRITGLLCLLIITSLLAVIYIKYDNHRLYNTIQQMQHKTQAVYHEHQVVASQKMKILGIEALDKFLQKSVHTPVKV